MSGIQVILLTGVAFIGLYFLVRLRKKLLDLILLLLMLGVAATFILFPSLTNKLAALLNVGRGADLVFYLSILIFWFVVLKLYAKVRQLEQAFTRFVRQDALNQAGGQTVNEKKDGSPDEEHPGKN